MSISVKKILIFFILCLLLLSGCIYDIPLLSKESNHHYHVYIKTLPSTIFTNIQNNTNNKILAYYHNDTLYFVYKTHPYINITYSQKDRCVWIKEKNISPQTAKNNLLSLPFPSSSINYSFLFVVIETSTPCIIKNESIFQANEAIYECYSDSDCIHKPSLCHPKAQPCVPYYTLTMEDVLLLYEKENIFCTAECRPCIRCACNKGKCISIKENGCC